MDAMLGECRAAVEAARERLAARRTAIAAAEAALLDGAAG
jgi:hypothetical protein